MLKSGRFFWLPGLISLALLTGPMGGCTGKEPRYPADHARYQKIDAAIAGLRQAYVKRDMSGFRALLLPSGLLDRMELDVEKDMQTFETITLDLSVERIVVNGDTVDVFVHWQGVWKKNQADAGLRERGHGMLRWVGMQSILLKSAEGDLPFGMATRRPASEPQKTGTGG